MTSNKSHVIAKIISRPYMNFYGTFEVFLEFTAYETPLMAVNSPREGFIMF